MNFFLVKRKTYTCHLSCLINLHISKVQDQNLPFIFTESRTLNKNQEINKNISPKRLLWFVFIKSILELAEDLEKMACILSNFLYLKESTGLTFSDK